jgi:hypothetical protein
MVNNIPQMNIATAVIDGKKPAPYSYPGKEGRVRERSKIKLEKIKKKIPNTASLNFINKTPPL